MINAIPMFNLFKLPNVQALSTVNSKSVSRPVEEKTLLPRTSTQMNVKEMAAAINDSEIHNTVVPTREEIRNSFLKGELDPRKFKPGEIVTLKIQGTEYKVRINEKGEFVTKVQGRDDSIRIYLGKNKKGEDCVCYDFRRKHTECNIYSTLSVKRTYEKYEKYNQYFANKNA